MSISRDQGLRRISLVTRWVGVAGIAAAGLFAAVAAKAQPGRTNVITPAVSGSAPSSAGVSTVDPTITGNQAGSQADNGLQAPVQAPQASRGRAAVVSGGS
jgi:hypothetical protein